ncbi:MAG: SagB/ThcOx family dehydrogenase [Nitriliruptorales bacterium]|nr:SagB/ThcOx family dehydrogenase [Nitriliruptorales bacterium]
MRRLRQDANHLISAGLFLVALAAILTGVIADLWDLNDFRWHTYAGYVMTAFALAHVALNWRKILAYARFRLRRSRPNTSPPRPRPKALPHGPLTPAVVGRAAGGALLSRRGVLGLGVGGLVGVVAGRGLRPPPVIPGGADVGVVYHEWSKPGVLDAIGTVADWGKRPPQYKQYPDANIVVLPEPNLAGQTLVEDAIVERHSTRDYSGAPMSPEELSQVLFLTAGMTRSGRRTHPSSGALYPIEVYPVVHNVQSVPQGVYHYGIRDHALERVRSGDFRVPVVRQGLLQEFLGECNVVLFLTVIFQRMRFKYRDRTYRYGLIEAGHLGQNVYLAAESMGLGACAIGAFLDDEMNRMLGVDGRNEAAVYMLSVGKV